MHCMSNTPNSNDPSQPEIASSLHQQQSSQESDKPVSFADLPVLEVDDRALTKPDARFLVMDITSEKKSLKMVTSVQWLFFLFAKAIVFLLGLRLLMPLLGAARDTPFSTFLYEVTGVLIRPFAGTLHPMDVGTMGQIETDVCLALGLYMSLLWIFLRVHEKFTQKTS